jgi:hypothetical protein
MSPFRIFLRVFALLATLTLAQAQAIPPREALVIGNSDYSFGPLRNPRNDAEAMAKALEEAGFDVTVATDAGQDAMEQAIQDFSEKLKDKGGVGLFYFSGHGAQINGENYLIPVSLTSAEQLESGSVKAIEIVDAMAKAHNGLNIVILDACRTNPFDPNGSHGPTPVIYSFGDKGALDGEWAGGSATESLTPVATADEDASPPEGEYSLEGRSDDVKEYSGTVTIAKEGEDYKLNWKVGDSEYDGDGTLDGNLLTVNWGSSTPVVYPSPRTAP